ncbi:MAG TPA: type II secretion system F family protein [Actinomycetota bacterium]|jgi:Flp pilus assembly protein TadB|nr:type II secretion system F family protein [Actinomycetota bacterium]
MKRTRSVQVVDVLRDVGDALRSGASLRQAIVRSAESPGSPLTPAASALTAGRPLVESLRATAASGHRGDADLSSALCILAVHAEAGGDPLPAVRALTDRLGRRAAARAEARALTTQARLGARALLLLTPAFLVLVVASDPGGVARWLAEPRTRAAVIAGVALQGIGAVWMGSIVRSATGRPSRYAGVPFLRAVRAVLAGRARSQIDAEVAEASETMAFALDAGLAPSSALVAVAPYARGEFGDALRRASEDVASVPHEAVTTAVDGLGGRGASRFAAAYVSSVTLGVPLAPALRSIADELREQASIDLAEDVRRASVRVLVPLGLVVLPAFVLACLVPLFVGGLEGITG